MGVQLRRRLRETGHEGDVEAEKAVGVLSARNGQEGVWRLTDGRWVSNRAVWTLICAERGARGM
jgi:hypothetical protein